MTNNVFAYGTLMLPDVVEALTGKRFTPKPAILHGYCRYVFKGKLYPGIIEDQAGMVEGVFYYGIDERTLSIFDWFEEVLYERHLLTVEAENDKTQAFVYVVADKFQYKLDHIPWNLDKFIRDYSKTYVQKCSGYRKQWEKENKC